MRKSRRFTQVDVFASRPGAGNPLAIVLDAEGLDDASMQAIATWTRLPETTFVFPAPHAGVSYGLRIFSPRREVPFAGHPSVGTAHAVLEAGLAQPVNGRLIQSGIAGDLPLMVSGEGEKRTISIRTPKASQLRLGSTEDKALMQAIEGIPQGNLPPVLMDGGRRWWLVEVESEAALRCATPNWDAIAALAEDTQSMGVFAYARSEDPIYYYAVRAWVGAPARFEDAASGAANAVLAAWLASQNAIPGEGHFYRVSQGREVGHDAVLELTVDDEGYVWSGGRVCTVVKGEIDWRD